jgi:hypothetical protein
MRRNGATSATGAFGGGANRIPADDFQRSTNPTRSLVSKVDSAEAPRASIFPMRQAQTRANPSGNIRRQEQIANYQMNFLMAAVYHPSLLSLSTL